MSNEDNNGSMHALPRCTHHSAPHCNGQITQGLKWERMLKVPVVFNKLYLH